MPTLAFATGLSAGRIGKQIPESTSPDDRKPSTSSGADEVPRRVSEHLVGKNPKKPVYDGLANSGKLMWEPS
jgi:hypothetical protein